MATPPRAPGPQSATGAPTPAPSAAQAIPTPAIISAMMKSKGVSDLIFSPGRAPQVELSGQLVEVKIAGLPTLSPEDTRCIAADLIGRNEHALRKLEQEGAADLSYSLPGLSRFRVNIFRQRGTYAIVMRVIPTTIPDFATLKLPAHLGEIANLRNGIVLVTGPTGSGKSSTLAAILNKINEEKAYHILTIEDPVEFLHNHKRSTIHQRELHSDTPTFALALRAALRQAPKVILVGEMRDSSTEGMQNFDGELDKLFGAGIIDLETCMAFATNPGNLRLELADVIEQKAEAVAPAPVEKPAGESEVEIVR